MLHWGVYFIVISTVFRDLGTVYIAGLTLNQAVILFLFFAALTSKLFRKDDVYRPDGLDITLVVFGIYFWISNFLISNDPEWGIRVCTHYLRSLTCYFLVVFLIQDRSKINLFVATYILSSLLMVFTEDLYSAVRSGLTFSLGRREGLTGLAGHYINYALYSLMSIPLAYYSLKNKISRLSKIFLVITIAILSTAVLFSGSRGGIVSFIVMTLALFALEFHNLKKNNIYRLLLLILLFFGVFSFFWIKGGNEMINSLLPMFTGKGKIDPSLAGRKFFVIQFFEVFLQHPIFGIGIDTSRNILTRHVPHNQWLQILSELGLVGMLLSLNIVYFVFRSLIKARKKFYEIGDWTMTNTASGLIVSIFTILFWGFYENIGLIAAEKVIFMLFALGVSLKQISLTAPSQGGVKMATSSYQRVA